MTDYIKSLEDANQQLTEKCEKLGKSRKYQLHWHVIKEARSIVGCVLKSSNGVEIAKMRKNALLGYHDDSVKESQMHYEFFNTNMSCNMYNHDKTLLQNIEDFKHHINNILFTD